MPKDTLAAGIEARDDIEVRLAALRRQRGAATLDGKPFDNSTITALELQLEAMDEADAELTRRERDAAARQRTAVLEACREDMVRTNDKRIAAVEQAEKALEQFAVAIGDVLKHATFMTALCREMGVPTPSAFTTGEHAQRISHYVAVVLKEMHHPSRFGKIPLPSSWMPGDRTMLETERKAVAHDIERLTGE